MEFEDRRQLVKEGYNLYAPAGDRIESRAADQTTVLQGYLENSNVSPVLESVHLIDTVRTYEVFQKIMLSFQEADEKSINEVGRLV